MQSNNDKDTTTNFPSPEKIMDNVMEGTLGERGELFVGLQFGLVFLVIIAPLFQESIESAGLVAGLALSAAGLLLGYAGVRQLGDSLSPWPKPINSNELQTNGPFALCRHPIYGGLLITCVGLTLITSSYPRLLFSVLLLLVLDRKAEIEEQFLVDKHGESYKEYCQNTPKLLPRDLSKAAQVVADLIK
mmetsp:Transcript_98070/g.143580  ORF Transcript_98070/g.143580 Transcript_98070/m.143580 type:complete len:189 (+) Transcript_98070:3-569(+)